jgi:peptidoglycan/xylan/chitin deacetylase (PgdA/CDA1 family)
MPPVFSRQQWTASALVGSGFSRWTRQRLRDQIAVLTFHGLRRSEAQSDALLDHSLHEPVLRFRQVCQHLASHYEVVTAEQAVALAAGSPPPPTAKPKAILTFDDGYASNLRLALPILREFRLPAIVFVSTQFIDGEWLWFQKLDAALSQARGARLTLSLGETFFDLPLTTPDQRRHALQELLAELKRLPWTELTRQVDRITDILGFQAHLPRPDPLQSLSWEELRHIHSEGLLEIGGHTHRHPILSRCTPAQRDDEIHTCARKLRDALGHPVRWFAYPNGGHGDFDARACQPALEAAGFEAAFSMINARVVPGSSRWALPRYGAPQSVWEAEATASGAFETLKQWRQRFKRNAAL